jgi:RHS repeat-associated protein
VPKSGNVGRFQYTGQIWLSELGLYHYKARLYSPYLGRFLQVDPVGYKDQINLYAYVADDPVNANDPTGLMNTNDNICTGSFITCKMGGGVTGGAAGVSETMSDDRSGRSRDQKKTTKPKTPPPDPTHGDKHLNFAEAKEHWRTGGGAPVDVDASKLAVRLERPAFKEGDIVGGTVVGDDDWKVHGGVSLRYRGGKYYIFDSPFDTEMHSGIDAIPRNIMTKILRGELGPGTPYLIRYHGSPLVYPRKACPDSRGVLQVC